MSSQKQIDANRRNAQKCTGPRSAEGKARSSMNALKTGIDAQARVIRGEKAEDLAALANEYYDRWVPTTPEERCLVDILISNDWLLRRLNNLETEFWQDCMPREGSSQNRFPLSGAFCNGDVFFPRLQSRLNSAQRNFRTALQQLQRIEAARATPPPPDPDPAPPPQPAETEPTCISIGFVPEMLPNPTQPPAAQLPNPLRAAGHHPPTPLTVIGVREHVLT